MISVDEGTRFEPNEEADFNIYRKGKLTLKLCTSKWWSIQSTSVDQQKILKEKL